MFVVFIQHLVNVISISVALHFLCVYISLIYTYFHYPDGNRNFCTVFFSLIHSLHLCQLLLFNAIIKLLYREMNFHMDVILPWNIYIFCKKWQEAHRHTHTQKPQPKVHMNETWTTNTNTLTKKTERHVWIKKDCCKWCGFGLLFVLDPIAKYMYTYKIYVLYSNAGWVFGIFTTTANIYNISVACIQRKAISSMWFETFGFINRVLRIYTYYIFVSVVFFFLISVSRLFDWIGKKWWAWVWVCFFIIFLFVWLYFRFFFLSLQVYLHGKFRNVLACDNGLCE